MTGPQNLELQSSNEPSATPENYTTLTDVT